MFYTNGVILIDSKNDPDALAKAVRKVTRYLEEETATEASFLLDDTVTYPCYSIPEGVTWAHLDAALRPHVQMRAINEDIITLPEKKVVTEKHYYQQSEKDQMGRDMAAKLVEKRKLEVRKSQLMKEYKADIDALQEDIDTLADNHQRGWEERETPCIIKLNFADETRYYIEVTDAGERVVSGEPLETKDYQMRIDVQVEQPLDPTTLTPEPGDDQLEAEDQPETEDDPNDGPGPADHLDGGDDINAVI